MNRIEFIKALGVAAAAVAIPRFCYGTQQSVVETYTYKTAGGCEIKADVVGVDRNAWKPVIVYIHGGALIEGSRRRTPGWLNPQGKYVVVSIDYRLAPTTKLPAIIEDIQDAFRWIRGQGPRLFHINAEKLAVAGESAGGYLTLMSGFCIKPRPTVLLALSGYGSIGGSWQTQPSPDYLKQPPVSREAAYAAIGRSCMSDPPEINEREKYFFYCRQKGIWAKEISGHDPRAEAKWFDAYCPVRNVSVKYPPTVLIHGTADTDVPFSESEEMDKAMSQFSVEHKFLRVPDGQHVLNGFEPGAKARIFEQAVDFLNGHMT